MLTIVAGVETERTPIIRYFMDFASRTNSCRLIEYKVKKRISFLLNVFKHTLDYNQSFILFNIQCLPIIYFLQLLGHKKIAYWALESYRPTDNSSFVLKLLYFEQFIDWTNVVIILPLEERFTYHNQFNYKKVAYINNAPLTGNEFIRRHIGLHDKIKLVFYGSLSPHYTYLSEFIVFINNNDSFELDIIGDCTQISKTYSISPNIRFLGRMHHNDLIEHLKSNYHFSIAGYKPVDFNHEFCAPNKVYESFSLSLPCIVNKQNPTLKNLINETSAGLIIDFDLISSEMNITYLREQYQKLNTNSFAAYSEKYNFESVCQASGLLDYL